MEHMITSLFWDIFFKFFENTCLFWVSCLLECWIVRILQGYFLRKKENCELHCLYTFSSLFTAFHQANETKILNAGQPRFAHLTQGVVSAKFRARLTKIKFKYAAVCYARKIDTTSEITGYILQPWVWKRKQLTHICDKKMSSRRFIPNVKTLAVSNFCIV